MIVKFIIFISIKPQRKCDILLKWYMELFQVSNKRRWTHGGNKKLPLLDVFQILEILESMLEIVSLTTI